MAIPAVSVKKSVVGGAPAFQTNDGIVAFIASSSTGTSLPPTMVTNQGQVVSNYVGGMLAEELVYNINVSGKPSLALSVAASVAGTYGTITKSLTGTATVTAGATQPLLHYNVAVAVVNGGTVGVAGITFTWTVDGGDVVSAVTALGTSSTLTLPGTGVSFTLGAGTLVAGDTWSCFTERPLLNNSDVSSSLVTLGKTSFPWEIVCIDAQYGTGTVSVVDTWLAGREANGQFNIGLLNTRFLNEPTPTAEAPSVYAAAIIAQTGSDASNRICVGADGGHNTSLLTGFTTKFPTSLALATMAASLTPNIGTSPSYVGQGPVEGFQISSNGNPNDWDEFLYQSLDSQRLVTLRSFASGGPVGTFITNPNVLCSTGSSIIWLQILRVLNKACSIAWQQLNPFLNKGVQTVYNATTGANNIKETSAQTIEGIVNNALSAGLSGQVNAVQFSVNRDDNLTIPRSPISCEVSVEPLFYATNINVTAAIVKTITVPQGGV